jgi:VanZ like protein
MSFPGFTESLTLPRPRRAHVALPFALMAILYWTSSIPGTPSPADPAIYVVFHWVSPSVQNAVHVPAYAVLAATWRWALTAWLQAPRARTTVAVALAAFYGVFDEWHQSFVPARDASLTDVALDVTGAVLGAWLAARPSMQPQIHTDKHGF